MKRRDTGTARQRSTRVEPGPDASKWLEATLRSKVEETNVRGRTGSSGPLVDGPRNGAEPIEIKVSELASDESHAGEAVLRPPARSQIPEKVSGLRTTVPLKAASPNSARTIWCPLTRSPEWGF